MSGGGLGLLVFIYESCYCVEVIYSNHNFQFKEEHARKSTHSSKLFKLVAS